MIGRSPKNGPGNSLQPRRVFGAGGIAREQSNRARAREPWRRIFSPLQKTAKKQTNSGGIRAGSVSKMDTKGA
nr:MAG TPA_asm: hypothetical protein [Bacteriophage sp.]